MGIATPSSWALLRLQPTVFDPERWLKADPPQAPGVAGMSAPAGKSQPLQQPGQGAPSIPSGPCPHAVPGSLPTPKGAVKPVA